MDTVIHPSTYFWTFRALLSVVRGDTGPRVPIFEEFGNSVSEVGGFGRGYGGLGILFESRGSIVLRRQCFESKDGGVEFAESVCVVSFLVKFLCFEKLVCLFSGAFEEKFGVEGVTIGYPVFSEF